MKILLSIKPEYAEKILNGEKNYEYRKSLPRKKGVATVVIYATLPVGKVIGEFDIEDYLTESPHRLWEMTAKKSGVKKEFYEKYFDGREQAHAIKVAKARRYPRPRLVNDVLGKPTPPQSFCYLQAS